MYWFFKKFQVQKEIPWDSRLSRFQKKIPDFPGFPGFSRLWEPCMGTAPTAFLGMILGVPLLHLKTKGRAVNLAYHLRSYGQWKPKRHNKIPLLDKSLLGMRMDFIQQCFHFGSKWTVTILSWKKWLQNTDSLPITDWSRAKDRTGAGYCSSIDGKGTWVYLGRYATIFQIKVMALLGCAQRLKDLNAENRYMSICSDSHQRPWGHLQYRLTALGWSGNASRQ